MTFDVDSHVEIRAASEREVQIAIRWAAEEGWNPGLADASRFYSSDPHGFFIGLIGGEPVATVSAVRYGDDYGFLGLYIVDPRMRGRGFGWRIWQAAMAHMGDRNVGLDGVVAQQHNYEKSGFRLFYRHVRYQGVAENGSPDPCLVDLAAVDFEELAAYDRRMFGADRRAFLLRWIDQPQGAAMGIREGERLTGYGVIRACGYGYKIGPLFASSPPAADLLFGGLCTRVAQQPVFLDVPDANAAAIALAQRHGMSPVFETARMYTQRAPETPVGEIYGVTTLELG
ncbi:MAG TPA: GNAT family N-acetyltransferase [Candidatus Baltobacteraceae bacterium]|nr:GNAT family N-acetyltransferase [Candidatus Baltobacteraceae bacterium]